MPKPYLAAAHGNDCDDLSLARWKWAVLYRDLDGDGVGLSPREISCRDDSIPDGWSIYGDDPDDADPSRKTDDEIYDLLAMLW